VAFTVAVFILFTSKDYRPPSWNQPGNSTTAVRMDVAPDTVRAASHICRARAGRLRPRPSTAWADARTAFAPGTAVDKLTDRKSIQQIHRASLHLEEAFLRQAGEQAAGDRTANCGIVA
jgi:hypothetical protein